MKKFLTLLSFLFICMFAVNMVSAVKVDQTNVNSANGLNIFYPQYEATKYNESFFLHVHVSNISNGVPFPNTAVDCYVHLYNSSGYQIFEGGAFSKDGNGRDLEVFIKAGNFTQYGYPNSFYIVCNNTAGGLGGQAKGAYYVTGNGKVFPSGIVVLGFVLMMMIIFMFTIFYLIRTVGLMIDASFDILDIAYAWGLYFGLLGLNQLAIIYLGTVEVTIWLNLFIKILAFPMVVIPVIAFFLSIFRENKTKEAERQQW